MKAIVCDIDGTLANVEHRVSHVQKEPKDWKSFNAGIADDELNIWCSEILKTMKNEGYDIVLLTGRAESELEVTKKWLEKHSIIYDGLFMRKSKDRREDSDVKKDIYINEIEPKWSVLFVLEDRLSVVKMWREIGVTCLQCDWGNF